MKKQNSKQKYLDACFILKQLEAAGYEARLVGGCVRDRQWGLEPKDFDIASSANPDQALSVFKDSGYKLLTMGKEHGTITVVMPSHPIEITTLREDVQTFGRKAEVAFRGDFVTDAARRDFTINALSEDLRGQVYDYHQGMRHLKDKLLYFVGDPEQRIKEDYLRILRFFRFKARYNLTSDQPTLETIRKLSPGLAAVSKERITSEISETFLHRDIDQVIAELFHYGVMNKVFPILEKVEKVPEQKLNRCQKLLCDLKRSEIKKLSLARFAAIKLLAYDSLGYLDTAPAEEPLFHYLKLSRKDELFLTMTITGWKKLLSTGNTTADALGFMNELDERTCKNSFVEFFYPLWKIYAKDKPTLYQKLDSLLSHEVAFGWRRQIKFPVDGSHVMRALSIHAGPEVGKYLESLRTTFYNGEWSVREEAIKLLKNS